MSAGRSTAVILGLLVVAVGLDMWKDRVEAQKLARAWLEAFERRAR